MTDTVSPGFIDPISEPLPAAVPLDGAVGRVHRAVAYAAYVGSRPLLLDVYLPHARQPAPVVLFVHGGGWRVGDRSLFCPSWSHWRPDPFARLVAAGFAVASVDYRLSGEACFPAQLEDVTAALRWLRVRAGELGIDPNRVVAWGESAGGHLAALLGITTRRTDSKAVVGVVDWYGPADLTTMPTAVKSDADSREAALLGVPPQDDPARALSASPVAHVHGAAPPFHLAHGTDDRFVPVAQSQQLADALREAGVEAELDLVAGADHVWLRAPEPETILSRALDFARLVTG